jgi:hypothetical protein
MVSNPATSPPPNRDWSCTALGARFLLVGVVTEATVHPSSLYALSRHVWAFIKRVEPCFCVCEARVSDVAAPLSWVFSHISSLVSDQHFHCFPFDLSPCRVKQPNMSKVTKEVRTNACLSCHTSACMLITSQDPGAPVLKPLPQRLFSEIFIACDVFLPIVQS